MCSYFFLPRSCEIRVNFSFTNKPGRGCVVSTRSHSHVWPSHSWFSPVFSDSRTSIFPPLARVTSRSTVYKVDLIPSVMGKKSSYYCCQKINTQSAWRMQLLSRLRILHLSQKCPSHLKLLFQEVLFASCPPIINHKIAHVIVPRGQGRGSPL